MDQNLKEFITVQNSDGSKSVHYRAFHEGVPEEYQNFAERELGETPRKVAEGINHLKRLLEDKGLPKTEERHLLAVLRNCKHDLRKSKAKLERFLGARALIAERVAELDFDEVPKILESACFTILPYRDKHGRLIVVTRPIEGIDINDGFVCYFALLLYSLEFPMTSLFGIVYIGECKTPSLSFLYRIMKAYKKWLMTLYDLPFGLRKIDVTNESVVIKWFMALARPITPAKIFKRVTLNGDNFEALQEVYHPDLLPDDFNGNLGPISCEHYKENFMDFMRKLAEEHRAKVASAT